MIRDNGRYAKDPGWRGSLRTLRVLLLGTMMLVVLSGGLCSPDPQPCQTLSVQANVVTVEGTLDVDGRTFPLSDCSLGISWRNVVVDAHDAIEERFGRGWTGLSIWCGDGPQFLVGASRIWSGAPFGEPQAQAQMAIRVDDVEGRQCTVQGGPSATSYRVVEQAGELWPDPVTAVSPDFLRVFELELAAAGPWEDLPTRPASTAPACERARTAALDLKARFRITANDVVYTHGLTCWDGMPM